MTNKGLLVILSGPSGAGKGTVIQSLLAQSKTIRLSVSATTRSPRPGETDGKEYYFISREKFSRMEQGGRMQKVQNTAATGTVRLPPRLKNGTLRDWMLFLKSKFRAVLWLKQNVRIRLEFSSCLLLWRSWNSACGTVGLNRTKLFESVCRPQSVRSGRPGTMIM